MSPSQILYFQSTLTKNFDKTASASYLSSCQVNPSGYKDLVSGFISLQKAVLERKIAKEYDYHGVAAPWIQMKNLRLMALLGADDQK